MAGGVRRNAGPLGRTTRRPDKTVVCLPGAGPLPHSVDLADARSDSWGRSRPVAGRSEIEWTDATWNPVVGCSPVSAGCRHCYAARMALRLSNLPNATGSKYRGTATRAGDGTPVFTGLIKLDRRSLSVPRTWRTRRMVFVNSMSDVFHEKVPVAYIREIFGIISECTEHTFQVLTKRPGRALQLAAHLPWPDNLWMGASIENRDVLDRVRLLQGIPAAVRFLSCEPLLGPLPRLPLHGIHWVIVGGESGPKARPMSPNWVREVKTQCDARDVRFFFKQWGGINRRAGGRRLDGKIYNALPKAASLGTRKT